MSAYQEIQDLYTVECLRDIRDHGCASGSAHYHIYTSDCVDFYNNHQDEIDEYICEQLGYDTVMQLTVECDDIRHAMNHLCWVYIELVASELVDIYDCDVERDSECQLVA